MAQRAYDIVVVGGGIVGLATARDLLKRRPGMRLAISGERAGHRPAPDRATTAA
jgi:L-2-hydroxyglutarate oxidase